MQDTARVSRFFTEPNHAKLMEQAQKIEDLDELAALINSFLDSLQVSHTRMVTRSDLEYFVYSILWSPWQLDTLPVSHIGIQWAKAAGRTVVRNVFEGYPAERAGIRRGDVIVGASGRPFHPLRSFAPRRTTVLSLRRNGRPLVLSVVPVEESIHRSLLQATKNSVRRVSVDGHQIGCVHVWTFLSPMIQEEFARIVCDSLAGVDGLVLDLRDGWGGWWLDFVDPFFADRSGYPVVSGIDRQGKEVVTPPKPAPAHRWFGKPVVAIVNEGTRSGKEGEGTAGACRAVVVPADGGMGL